MNLGKYLKARKKYIDKHLGRFLPASKDCLDLQQAIRYSVLGPGKRIRPILTLEAVRVCGGQPRLAVPTACAIELIHVFTLIHDDLPAMDNADYRRGKLSNHKKFGEAIAILAGDALNPLAFEIISKQKNLAPEIKIKVIAELSQALGVLGVVGGQVLDIKSQSKNVPAAVLRRIHLKKTGALIKAAVRAGAIIAGASPKQLYFLTQFAHHLGVEFQVIDDIMDVTGSFKKTGKPVGSDAKQSKATYPAVFGLQQAGTLAQAEARKALSCLSCFGAEAHRLRRLVKYVLDREA